MQSWILQCNLWVLYVVIPSDNCKLIHLNYLSVSCPSWPHTLASPSPLAVLCMHCKQQMMGWNRLGMRLELPIVINAVGYWQNDVWLKSIYYTISTSYWCNQITVLVFRASNQTTTLKKGDYKNANKNNGRIKYCTYSTTALYLLSYYLW